jgi:hypothetical protein
VQGLADADIHKDAPGYVGPTGRSLMLYALLIRRDLLLPDLDPPEGTRAAFSQASTRTPTSAA